MFIVDWLKNNFIEIFGAVTGIVYVFLEIRQTIWLWPVGIVTSAVYIWIFFTSKIYADMTLQGYYLIISILGWYWWSAGKKENNELNVTHLKLKTGLVLAAVFSMLFTFMWLILSKLTDSPVPVRDSFVTSLSIVATWMLARKIYEHWYLWIVVNFVSAAFFLSRGLFPTVILYIVYGVMSFAGLIEWHKSIANKSNSSVEY